MDNTKAVQAELSENEATRTIKQQNLKRRALLGVSLVPWINLAVWTAFALITRYALGHFPQCYWEDAPWAVWAVFYPLVVASFFLLLASLPVWYALYYGHSARWIGTTAWRADVVYGLGWATTFLLAYADPVSFLRWFID